MICEISLKTEGRIKELNYDIEFDLLDVKLRTHV